MIFPYMYRMCNDQIRVINISITSSFYHFFVLGTSKIVSSSYLEIYNKFVLTVVILQCFRTLELFFLSSCNFVFVNQPLPIHPPSPVFVILPSL